MQDAATAAVGEQGGQAGFQALAAGMYSTGGAVGGCQAMATSWHLLLVA